MQIFYAGTISEHAVILEEQEHHHVSKVLRKKEGDTIYVCNGKGLLVKGRIESIEKRKTAVYVEDVIANENENKNNLVLAVSPTKKRDRYEWMVEKCVEIGVSEIIPFYSQNSERKTINIDRLNNIALSAMKQSKSLFLPKIHEPISFKSLLSLSYPTKYIAYVEENQQYIQALSFNTNTPVMFAIGPEGGFTSAEVNQAKENDYLPVALGQKRLRTETAGIFVATAYQLLKQ